MATKQHGALPVGDAAVGKARKIRRVGNSLGLTLPKEMLDALHLGDGSDVTVIPTPDGLLLTPTDPEFQRDMELFEGFAERYRNTLRELAK